MATPGEMEPETSSEESERQTKEKEQHTDPAEGTPDNKVNSHAIVKSSRVAVPIQFSQLEMLTDLREPPSNWLESGTHIHSRNTWVQGEPSQFSSFEIADSLPEIVGEVHVISASENIKQLLKIPFSENQVSMAVHRIGNTLLLDELDIIKHLRAASQAEQERMKSFICQTVLEEGQNLRSEKKTSQMLQRQNLLSKFLCYSLGDDIPKEPGSPERDEEAIVAPADVLPEAKRSEFARQVYWQFEDIRMLIGTDLPIFGGGKYPAVSLRLKDMSNPINVLTGMDYWLDNLMCNVPELVMCYHLNGIVKKYELLKTDEIPHLENASFSPKVVKDIAQNILSFLKSNCTQEGHTYWLFKGHNDDVVKLYDLSSLCEDYANTYPSSQNETDTENPWENPFVAPVALLLCRVARNMSQNNPGKREKDIIYKLLKNCLKLLDKTRGRHPDISSSAYFFLSNLLTSESHHSKKESQVKYPEDIGQETEYPTPSASESEQSSGSDSDEDASTPSVGGRNLALPPGMLNIPGKKKRQGKKDHLPCSKEERMKAALVYIIKGLKCIKAPRKQSTSSSPSSSPSRRDNMLCLPPADNMGDGGDSAAALPPTSKDLCPLQNAGDSENTLPSHDSPSDIVAASGVLVPAQNSIERAPSTGSWQYEGESQRLLLSQACQVFLYMAEKACEKEKYGTSLLYAAAGLKCFVGSHTQTLDPSCLSRLLTVCGDALLLMSHNLSRYDSQILEYAEAMDEQEFLLEYLHKLPRINEYNWACEMKKDKERNLRTSILCYMTALDEGEGCPKSLLIDITRKLANAQNELGVCYMNKALKVCNERKDDDPSKEEQELWQSSYKCFESGINAFTEVSDQANTALLYCNTGRLMRLCAESFSRLGSSGQEGEFSAQERHYFNQAVENYHKALTKLGGRKKSPAIWDAVSWELCTTLFNQGCLLQDHAPLTVMAQEQIEREIQDKMNKALTFCDKEDIPVIKQPLYQYRVALIHHRLGSLYHNMYRNQSSQQKQRRTRSLADLHYNKSIIIYQSLDRYLEVVRVQLEKLAVLEHHFEGQSGITSRAKSLQLMMKNLSEAKHSLIHFKMLDSQTQNKDQARQDSQEARLKCGTISESGPGSSNMLTKVDESSTNPNDATLNDDVSDIDDDTKAKSQKSVVGGIDISVVSISGNDKDITTTLPPFKELEDAVQVHSMKPDCKGEDMRNVDKRDPYQGHMGTSPAPCLNSDHPERRKKLWTGTSSDEEPRGYSDDEEEMKVLLNIFEKRLQTNLLKVIKLFHNNKKGNPEILQQYKEIYAMSLSTKRNEGDQVKTLLQCLEKLHHVAQMYPLA